MSIDYSVQTRFVNGMTGSEMEGREKRLDRRVSRTQSALRNAFLELIQEKGYETITVEQITERADLGRSTFYLHYRDKEELLLSYFSDLVEDRLAQFSQISFSMLRQPESASALAGAAVHPILGVFQHAAENASLYRIVLKGEGAVRVAEPLRRSITQAMDEMLRTKLDEEGLELKVSVDLFAHYLVGALLACLNWWLEQDMPCPAEEMARMFRLMLFPGVRAALGINIS
jgi:AcrR family transcriptional regulator